MLLNTFFKSVHCAVRIWLHRMLSKICSQTSFIKLFVFQHWKWIRSASCPGSNFATG